MILAPIGATHADAMMDDFREYLLGLGLADQTVRNYVAKCRLAREWAETSGIDLTAVRPSELRALQGLVPNSHSSRRHLRSALGYYWRFCGVDDAPAEAIRVPKKPPPFPRALPARDADSLATVGRRHIPEGWIVGLGLYAGFRREEMAWGRWEWFDRRWEWVTILGKGGVTRHVPIHPDLRSWLRPYAQSSGYIFPGTQGRRHIAAATVNKWFGRLCDEARVEGTPHQLRHTFAQTVYDRTGDIYVVQNLLGHTNVVTTQVYAHVGEAQMVEAVRRLGFGSHLSAIGE